MGHNSFIKGSITHVSLGFQSLSVGAALHWNYLVRRGSIGCTCESIGDPSRCHGCDGGVLGGIIQVPLSVLHPFCPWLHHRTNNFCWTVGPRTRERKVVIQCDNVTMQLHTPKRNGRKSLCNYTQWHVSPNYNDVYHNWRRLCSNSTKPPIPQHTWPHSSPAI